MTISFELFTAIFYLVVLLGMSAILTLIAVGMIKGVKDANNSNTR